MSRRERQNQTEYLSTIRSNYPHDYLLYATARRNKLPAAYTIWDSIQNDEYTSPSLHSQPASLATLNHITPVLASCHSSSPSSWDSSLFSSKKWFSLSCCAISLATFLIITVLISLIGISVYLGVITNLNKSIIMPVSGRMKVIIGDEFEETLYNTSSELFLNKAKKYENLLQTAFQDTPIEKAIVKEEVYAFRKGSLYVYFRIYLNRKKIFENKDEDFKSFESFSHDTQAKGDYWISAWVQNELREGIGQLRILHADPLKVDLKTVEVIPQYYDPNLKSKDLNKNLSHQSEQALKRSDVISNVVDNKFLEATTEPLKEIITNPTVIFSTTNPVHWPFSVESSTESKQVIKNSIPDFTFSSPNSQFTTVDSVSTSLKPIRYTRINNVASRTSSTQKLIPSSSINTSINNIITTNNTTTTTTTTTANANFTIRTVATNVPTFTNASTTTSATTFAYVEISSTKKPKLTTSNSKPLIIRPRPKVTSTTSRSVTRLKVTTERPVPTLSKQDLAHFVTVAPLPPHHKPTPGTMIKVSSVDYGRWRPLSPFSQPLLNQGQMRPVSMMPHSEVVVPRIPLPSRVQPVFDSTFQFNRRRPTFGPEFIRQSRKESTSFIHPDKLIPVPVLIEKNKPFDTSHHSLDFLSSSSHLNVSLKNFIDSLDLIELATINTSSEASVQSIPLVNLALMNFNKSNKNINLHNQSNLSPSFNLRVINDTSTVLRPQSNRKSRKNTELNLLSNYQVSFLPLPQHLDNIDSSSDVSNFFVSNSSFNLKNTPNSRSKKSNPNKTVESSTSFYDLNKTNTKTNFKLWKKPSEYVVDASLHIMESQNQNLNTSVFTKSAQFVPFESSRLNNTQKVSNHVKRHEPYLDDFVQKDWTARPTPFVRIGIMNPAFILSTPQPISVHNYFNYGQRLPKFIPPSNEPQVLHSNEILIGQSTPENNNQNFFSFFNYSSLMDLLNDPDASILTNKSEVYLTRTTSSITVTCSPAQFRCDLGGCISSSEVCNRKRDCIDGSDEKNCRCIDYFHSLNFHRKICDGIIDCWDFTDETNCSWCNSENSYICPGSKICIPMDQVCDGSFDCPDGSDEEACVALITESKMHVSDKVINANSRVLNSQGVLFVQKRGKWAPFCLNTLETDTSTSELDLKWRIEDLGGAVCVAQSYQGMISVEIINYQAENFKNFYQLNDPYNMFKSSTKWSLLFKSSDCKAKKMISINCKDFECGVRPPSNSIRRRIVGGNSARSGSWPWQVALYREGEFQCGGVLIDQQWVLSAAHCFHSTRNAYWTARLGILRRGNQFANPFEQLIKVENIIVHPEYVDKGFINDIVLLKLQYPVNFSELIRPLCLPNEEEDINQWHGKLCSIIGWGKLLELGKIFPDTLQEVRLPVISTEECRKRTIFLPLYRITDNMFCAGYSRGGRDACLGDSGGPLMCQKRDGRWSLLGVTSNGDGCGRASRPGVYTKVANYINWIKETIEKKNLIPDPEKVCLGIRCPLGKCLNQSSICNGIEECRDSSDELNCNFK